MRLTQTQTKVLTDLAAGGVLHYMGGPNAYYFLATKAHKHYGVRPATVSKLYDAKLIEGRTPKTSLDPDFFITDAGRKALRGRD